MQDSVYDYFFRPLFNILAQASNVRSCPQISDYDWMEVGLARVLGSFTSGRDFLSQSLSSKVSEIKKASFFEGLKSKRRLRLCEEVASQSHKHLRETVPDRLADAIPSLEGFDVYAGDGHWHAAATHDACRGGKKRAVGHLYGLNLRYNALIHLQMADESKLHENDITALKRTDIKVLRQGAPKGRSVLWVWDKAGIDFQQWYRWKHGSGIYFLSLEKENMKLEEICEYSWDREDAVNHGVVSDHETATSQHVSVRKVVYINPVDGKKFVFITNLPNRIPPGAIAQLYRMRWDPEKVFDELKNKLNERKAWASSENAKRMQASFICLAYNLIEAESVRLERENEVRNEAELKRKKTRLDEEREKAGGKLPALYEKLQRFTQHSIKFIRWLRSYLWKKTSLEHALVALRVDYKSL